MTKETYKHALDSAVADLNKAIEEKQKLATAVQQNHERILYLRHTIAALSNLIGDESHLLLPDGSIENATSLGLKEACHQVLSYQNAQTVNEVIAVLNQMGFNLKRYTNAYAAVQTTLNRLSDVETTLDRDGKTAYRLKVAIPKPPVPPPNMSDSGPTYFEGIDGPTKTEAKK
jgi:hypothetical protein